MVILNRMILIGFYIETSSNKGDFETIYNLNIQFQILRYLTISERISFVSLKIYNRTKISDIINIFFILSNNFIIYDF